MKGVVLVVVMVAVGGGGWGEAACLGALPPTGT